MKRYGLPVILVAGALAACDGDNAFNGIVDIGDDVDDAAFTATVSGDVQRTLSGGATFAATQTGTGDATLIILLEDAEDGSIRLSRQSGGVPAPGVVPVFDHRTGTSPDGQQIAATWITPEGGMFISLAGTVVVRSAAATRITGDLAFTAQRIFQVGAVLDTQLVTVSGSFEAAQQDPAGRLP